jgi:hypothetical protein
MVKGMFELLDIYRCDNYEDTHIESYDDTELPDHVEKYTDYCDDDFTYIEFINVNKIKKWYKNRLFYIKNIIKIDTLAEFSAQYIMDPRRDNNKHLEKIIKDYD